jgi:hypothetical protein
VTALSLSLAYLGTLAFAAFCIWRWPPGKAHKQAVAELRVEMALLHKRMFALEHGGSPDEGE